MENKMKLYYCCNCRTVAAFNIFDINKHDLTRPEDITCQVCQEDAAYVELELEKMN